MTLASYDGLLLKGYFAIPYGIKGKKYRAFFYCTVTAHSELQAGRTSSQEGDMRLFL
ncbi:MAG: hypothetical protein M1276_04440 [Deltaproteobacteria bacterium]|nr:hypothetical protein [Deltaproteobacteria bacterium]